MTATSPRSRVLASWSSDAAGPSCPTAVNAAVQSFTAAARSPRRRASLARTHRPNGRLVVCDELFGKVVAAALVRERSEAIEVGSGLGRRLRQDGFDRAGNDGVEIGRVVPGVVGLVRGDIGHEQPADDRFGQDAATVEVGIHEPPRHLAQGQQPYLRTAGGLIGVEANGVGDQAGSGRVIDSDRPAAGHGDLINPASIRSRRASSPRLATAEPHGVRRTRLGIAARGLEGSARRRELPQALMDAAAHVGRRDGANLPLFGRQAIDRLEEGQRRVETAGVILGGAGEIVGDRDGKAGRGRLRRVAAVRPARRLELGPGATRWSRRA